MAHAPAAHQPGKQESGITKAGFAAALVLALQGNAFTHRTLVHRGKSEFVLWCMRFDVHGLSLTDYSWVWDKLVATKPPDLHEYPNGTILDDRGFPVRPDADDVANAEHMARVIEEARARVFLG